MNLKKKQSKKWIGKNIQRPHLRMQSLRACDYSISKRFRCDIWEAPFLLTRKTESIMVSLLGVLQAVVKVVLASVLSYFVPSLHAVDDSSFRMKS